MFYRFFINLTNELTAILLLTHETVTTNMIRNTPTKPLHECSNCVGFFMPVTLFKKVGA
jgi:hypothetical protein